jgi:hypothetical protein
MNLKYITWFFCPGSPRNRLKTGGTGVLTGAGAG